MKDECQSKSPSSKDDNDEFIDKMNSTVAVDVKVMTIGHVQLLNEASPEIGSQRLGQSIGGLFFSIDVFDVDKSRAVLVSAVVIFDVDVLGTTVILMR